MSAHGLVKSMIIIGSAQSVNILVSLMRMKVLAILLGPTGVALLATFNSVMSTGTTLAGLGLGASGVRQIAASRGSGEALSRVRHVLLWANLGQGTLAMIALWLVRERLALWLLDDPAYARQIGLIGVGVLLGLIAASQTALLQGMRRIGDLARVTVFGAVAATVAGLLAVWLQGEDGLIWFLLVQPLTAILVAAYYTRRLPRPAAISFTLRRIWETWRPMAGLGAVFMLGGLATAMTLLLVRTVIIQSLGLEAAGHFAAAWSITMQYVGFLLVAMAADYFPRLTEVINTPKAATALMNDQTQIGLALGGPVLLLLIGLAPWVIELLYSAEFGPAASLLQWQTLGNIFKLASWPLSFALIAAARSRAYLFIQISWNTLFLLMIWVGLPRLGLTVTGIAFLIAYAFYFVLVNLLLHRLHAFRWERLSLALIGGHAGLGAGLFVLARLSPVAGAVAAVGLALLTGLVGARIVLRKIGPEGRLASKLARLYQAIGWPVEKADGE